MAGNGYLDRLRDNPNGSLAKFYNYCFSLASSEYVMKWDAHGLMFPEGINNIQKAIKLEPDCIYFNGLEFYGKSLNREIRIYKKTWVLYIKILNNMK